MRAETIVIEWLMFDECEKGKHDTCKEVVRLLLDDAHYPAGAINIVLCPCGCHDR